MASCNKRYLKALSLFWLIAVFTGRGEAVAQGFDSHVHGQAELNAVAVGQQMQIEFVSPAINLLGFEREPVSPEETALLERVLADLQSVDWLLGDALDKCQLSTVTVEAPLFGEHAHEHEDHEPAEDDHENDAGSHAEFHMLYLYDCPEIPAREFRVTGFEKFGGIEEITVQWVTEKQQGLAELTAGNPLFTLE